MLQAGQLTMGGTRVTFKTNGTSTGMNSNPRYMKAWAKAANELKIQGKSEILDGFWPRIDSQDVIQQTQPSQGKRRHEECAEKGDRSGRRK
jgi:hypothetical protein